ncbi:MAG TPA: glycosyltransferase family 39 protein [Candidatus Saccharimonadales bacterium]|nr:glycosyltransferase family 39 protein [Candidatus Saccharimonadales bacterium]
MNADILIILLLFIVSLILLFKDFNKAIVTLLLLSVLLHKELFSFYLWDLLPVRVFMLAMFVYAFVSALLWMRKVHDVKKIQAQIAKYLTSPFVLFLGLMWIVSGISIYFTKNLNASINLYAFFSTVVVLGVVLYTRFKNKPDEILNYIKFYIYIVFALCLFGFFQFALYEKFGIVIGALWNIPNNLPRIGTSFWDVNHFGALLASLLPVFGVLILLAKQTKTRIVYSLMFLAMLVILFLTNSRSAWILASVALLTFVTILFIKFLKTKGVLIVTGALIVIAIPILLMYSNKSSWFRAEVKQYFHYRIDSYDSHFLLLRGTFEIFEKYPFFGGGYGSFFDQFTRTDVSAEYFSRDPAALNTRVPAHTIWGELVSETGVFGLLAFILFMGTNLLILLHIGLDSKKKENYLLATAMFSAVLGFFVAGIFYSYNSEFFWLIIFLYFLYGISVFGKDTTTLLNYYGKLSKVPVIVIAVIAAVLIFMNLGVNHLIPWDEAIYAKVAKNMVVQNNYITEYWVPSIVWYEKPPFYMWLEAGFMGILGFNALAARFPSAIFGFATVLLVFFFARRLFNKTAAFLAALALATTFQFLYYARSSMLDVTTAFFVLLSLIIYYVGREDKKSLYFVLGGIACGFGVLTKGVGGLLPFPIIILFEAYCLVVLHEKFTKKLFLQLLVFGLLSLVIFMPWHIVMYVIFGNSFIKNYIGYHVLDRATEAIEDKGRPFLWYLEVMKVSMRIWFIALLGAFPLSVYLAIKKSKKHVFLVLSSLVIFFTFSVAKSKLVWYIIPIYPIAAVMIGDFSDQALTLFLKKFKYFNTVVYKTLFIFFVTVFALMYLFLNRNLVYLSDLTGSQATLIQEKDTIFGTEPVLQADLIEQPLLLFYSDGNFKQTNYANLGVSLNSLDYTQDVVFITKESRFRNYAVLHPQLILEDQIKEWALGYLPSAYSVDKNALKNVMENEQQISSKILQLQLDPKADKVILSQLKIQDEQLLNQENALILKMTNSLKISQAELLLMIK